MRSAISTAFSSTSNSSSSSTSAHTTATNHEIVDNEFTFGSIIRQLKSLTINNNNSNVTIININSNDGEGLGMITRLMSKKQKLNNNEAKVEDNEEDSQETEPIDSNFNIPLTQPF